MRRRTQEVTDIYDEWETSPSTQSSTLIKYFALTTFFWFKMGFHHNKKSFKTLQKGSKQKKKKKSSFFWVFEKLWIYKSELKDRRASGGLVLEQTW